MRLSLAVFFLLASSATAFTPARSGLRPVTIRQRRFSALFGESSETGQDEFVNDGPLAWLQPYLDMFGIEPDSGKQVFFGPIAVNVDKPVDEATATKRRQQAAEDMVNIGPEERSRRDKAGNVMLSLASIYVVWASLFADDGGIGGHFLRFLSIFPIFLGVGYKLSAKFGL